MRVLTTFWFPPAQVKIHAEKLLAGLSFMMCGDVLPYGVLPGFTHRK